MKKFGWLGPAAAVYEYERLQSRFGQFRIFGQTQRRRTCAWDNWQKLGWDINQSTLYGQDTGDCVSFGAAIVVAAVAAHEIVRLGQPEKFEVPFPPYLYGISRMMPEGGNGRLRGDGSLGSWMADTIVQYGVLRENYPGVPQYSGDLADRWGRNSREFEKFFPEGRQRLIKTAAPLHNVEDVIDAVCNGYYVTIASMRGYAMKLKNEKGKSWYTGKDTWPHQMSFIAYDEDPEPCLYRRNQWRNAHGEQLDGPAGGGWVRAADVAKEIASSESEVYAYSNFIGFPAEREKPLDYFA